LAGVARTSKNLSVSGQQKLQLLLGGAWKACQ
jgi:hypothetical protein